MRRKSRHNSKSSNDEKRLSKDSNSSASLNQIEPSLLDTTSNYLNKSGDEIERSSFASASNSFNNDSMQYKSTSKKSSPVNKQTEKAKKPWYSVSVQFLLFKNKFYQKDSFILRFSC